MSLDNEARLNEFEEKQEEKMSAAEFEGMGSGENVASEESQGIDIDFSFLTAKTGEGSVESYIEHPLNYKGSKGLAQVIRGFTGMFGALDLALVDIALGGLNMIKEGKAHGTV